MLNLINLIIIDIKNDNIFLYLHFSEKGIYSAVNKRTTTEKEQGRSRRSREWLSKSMPFCNPRVSWAWRVSHFIFCPGSWISREGKPHD